MSTDVKLEVLTRSVAETEAVGETIGSRLRGGEVIELSSDLGGGKTTLVRGLARGAGSAEQVSSPTFTVSKQYDCHRTARRDTELHIHHFDFYRLAEAGIVSRELAELLEDTANVVVVEWPAAVQSVLPSRRITISLERVRSGEDHRRLVIEAADGLEYLIDGLGQEP